MQSLVVALAVLVSSCSCAPIDQYAPAVHPQQLRFTPSAVYRAWWEQMKECSKDWERDWAPVPFASITFTMVEVVNGDVAFKLEDAKSSEVYGLYNPERRSITLTQAGVFSRELVGHEMLHALGYSHHPVLEMRCGVIVR